MHGALNTGPAPAASPRIGSVRRRLLVVVLTTTAVALLFESLAMLAYDVRVTRSAFAADLATEAQILALATAPALAFTDPESADRNLGALRARASIRSAALYLPDGRRWRSYAIDARHVPPATLPATDTSTWSTVTATRAVVRDGMRLGTVYLRAEYRIGDRLATYLTIASVVAAAALALAAVLSRRLQRSITDPIERVTAVARGIVSDRTYARRVPPGGDDETGVLVDAFNAMVDEVQARTAALEAEIEARARAETALRVADRRKDEFLATLAHELRNPLAPVRNAARLLENPAASDVQRAWGSQVIARQVGRMALLLDDLLDLSRITRGVFELRWERVALESIVQTAVETAQPLIQGKQHVLNCTLPDAPLLVQGDPLRLSQAVSNLLTNAAKYTDPGGRIRLEARVSPDGSLAIAVEDSGVGLDPAIIPQLFQMFMQVGGAVDRSEGGLGIGLALVKGLIELHGGTVEATSPGPGRGSTFTLRLPADAVVRERVPTVRSIAPTTPAGGARVLVVDDNRDAADSLAAVLRLAGHHVWVGYEGAQALVLAQAVRPDAMLLDIGMPGMSGYDVARELRSQAWAADLLLIAVTGFGQREDCERARAAGFTSHCTKPVDPAEIDRLLAPRATATNRSVAPFRGAE